MYYLTLELPDGSFYSPMYTIKNNGSKNISVSIDSFERKCETLDSDTVPLYIESLNEMMIKHKWN